MEDEIIPTSPPSIITTPSPVRVSNTADELSPPHDNPPITTSLLVTLEAPIVIPHPLHLAGPEDQIDAAPQQVAVKVSRLAPGPDDQVPAAPQRVAVKVSRLAPGPDDQVPAAPQRVAAEVPTPHSTSKYGNDAEWESPLDTYVFVPLGELLVDPAYAMGLTPNGLTCLSTVFEQMAVIFLMYSCNWTAVLMYLIGYVFDCADGKMARKYKMTTLLGCVLDFNTDMIVHVQLYAVILWRCLWGINLSMLAAFVALTLLCNYYYGLAQAYMCVKKTNHDDDFYSKYCREYALMRNHWFYALFLWIHKGVYDTYRTWMPVYDEVRLMQAMRVMHYFGPGTYAVFLALVMGFDAFNGWDIDGTVLDVMLMLNFIILTAVEVSIANITMQCYHKYGAHGQYRAVPVIHYFGVGLGIFTVCVAHSLPFVSQLLMAAGGVALLTFHVAYDVNTGLTAGLLSKLQLTAS